MHGVVGNIIIVVEKIPAMKVVRKSGIVAGIRIRPKVGRNVRAGHIHARIEHRHNLRGIPRCRRPRVRRVNLVQVILIGKLRIIRNHRKQHAGFQIFKKVTSRGAARKTCE